MLGALQCRTCDPSPAAGALNAPECTWCVGWEARDLAHATAEARQLSAATPLPVKCPATSHGHTAARSHGHRYDVARRAALAAGGRSGPVALCVFSCTGRGRAIFGEANAENEARIADEVSCGVVVVGVVVVGLMVGVGDRHDY